MFSGMHQNKLVREPEHTMTEEEQMSERLARELREFQTGTGESAPRTKREEVERLIAERKQIRAEQGAARRYETEVKRVLRTARREARISEAEVRPQDTRKNLCPGRKNLKRPCPGQLVKRWTDTEFGDAYMYVCGVCGRFVKVKQ